MLDTETRRRIDTARDILVGKVPDPKSQVEQITIALIYKFMDDMDIEAEELGGERSFFAGEYAIYSWAKLMHSGLGGHELLNRYAEGIAKLPENPGIPPLFRDIFKNAYLPYRDPETLRSFLKIIDEFRYDHSERLGDAFEYLLSVLGSQGDAGQFRTPRHIIDFVVEIIDPKKNEVILDPACGTAGFLISSYKHIVRANTDARGHSALTPDERGRMARNIRGYDISPDMVRLSLVNMYLHGFSEPHIDEYDTLTSEDRWNELADVILANPPFMSPKGGIRPHKRFSIQAKRSEVLFVDYIAEHLAPAGRAGVIVPEGIIFQSQSAYAELRKMLVEQALVAVVSLPAGVFNPYSGVKTSILILDRGLARQSSSIAFFKVENDGYGLGAQRRAIEKNDLPVVKAELHAYMEALRSQQPTDALSLTKGHVVAKARIAANKEYNLSGERYAEGNRLSDTKWPIASLGELCSFMTGGTPTSTITEYYENGTIPWLVSGDIHKGEIWDCEKRITTKGVENSNARVLPHDSVLIALNGQGKTRGTVALLRMRGATCNQSLVAISPVDRNKLISEFLFLILRSMYTRIRALTGDNERSGLNIPILKSIKIPLPPLDIQRAIVAEIEGYQRVIDGARAVLDNYRPHIAIDAAWPMTKLEDICETITDGDHQPPPKAHSGVPFVTITNINDDHKLDFTKTFFVPEAYYDNLRDTRRPRNGDILYTVTGSYGIPVLIDSDARFCFQRHIALIRTGPQILNTFLCFLFESSFMLQQAHDSATGVAQKTVSLSSLRNFSIPLPPLETQRAIVAEIEAEQRLVAANRELIARFERKIQAAIARVWGDEANTSQGDTRHETRDAREGANTIHETRDAREEDASVREQGEERQAVLDL